jgi:hypothetical protein
MKRDFDLIREILLAVKALPTPAGIQYHELLVKIPGHDFQFMAYYQRCGQQRKAEPSRLRFRQLSPDQSFWADE